MLPRVSVITLAVADLARSVRFYRDGLGLPTEGIAVDEIMTEAAAAGATLVKPAQATFWGGYAGYFQDPDGHLWEVVHNPAWPPSGA